MAKYFKRLIYYYFKNSLNIPENKFKKILNYFSISNSYAIMEDERLHIFVDESGTPKLSDNLENADYYVVVALLISDSLLENFKNSACEIKFNYAGSGELKSSSVGNNLSRRQKILQDIK